MSAVHDSSPPPPSPPAPPPDAEPEGAGNPWERRDSLGWFDGLVAALRLFILSPNEAFRQTRRRGDLMSPVLFALLMGLAGAILSQLWVLALAAPWLASVPAEAWGVLGFLAMGPALGLVVQLAMAPLVVVVGLLVVGALVHGCLLLVGGTAGSDAGFEGTFRVIAYTSVSQLASVVPLAGGFIVFFWGIALTVIGLTSIHRTSPGKSLAAVLIAVGFAALLVMTLLFIVALGALFLAGSR